METLVLGYLRDHPCVDCGIDDVRVLEFDHRQGASKDDAVAEMVRNRRGWARIRAEIAKCDVRCANCHRIKTGEQFGYWKNHGH